MCVYWLCFENERCDDMDRTKNSNVSRFRDILGMSYTSIGWIYGGIKFGKKQDKKSASSLISLKTSQLFGRQI